jgi:proteasome beta subunit
MEDKDKEKLVRTGTTTVGIVCSDGIVMAADKRTSAGYMVANKKQKKIVQITDNMAVAQAGLVSDAQLLSKLIKAEIMLYQNIRKMSMVPGIVGFILGGYDEEGPQLYELGVDGSVTKFDDFSSDGSGSVFALGVLETLYQQGITVDEGVKLAVKAINASLKKDLATGDGVDVVTLTSEGFKHVMTKEVKSGIEE